MTAPWPFYGPAADQPGMPEQHGCPVLNGHANTLPDFVGPLDGSARLTILTEGNHFPVLLPLVFDVFPQWAAAQGVALNARDVLVVTLPQPMIASMLVTGGIRLGNARLTVSRQRGLWPDLVMAGEQALRPLAKSGHVQPEAVAFCKHLGLGMLLRADACHGVETLADLAQGSQRIITASPREHVRAVYKETVFTLLGSTLAEQLWSRLVDDFPAQLDIQHRDLPHALMTGQADAALLFRHLAAYWAGVHRRALRFALVPGAEAWGRTICMAHARPEPTREAMLFHQFVLEQAATVYPAAGFAPAAAFAYGRAFSLA